MKFSRSGLVHILEIAFLASPSLVSACEGECIVGITKAFIGNYTAPIDLALSELANSIVAQLIPDNDKPAISYLSPIIDEYNRRAYDYMENAIFKSCFHGKCLDSEGREPAGCPNPDCPIICGTPGSLIHFYTKLRYIVFNGTAGLFDDVAGPHSAAYKKVEQRVVDAASSNTQRRFLRFRRNDLARQSGLDRDRSFMEVTARGNEQTKHELQAILRRFRQALNAVCGGSKEDNETNGLPNCSWKQAFHDYILSFP